MERRLAKRGLQGNFARARAFYRAATEELKGLTRELSSSRMDVMEDPSAQTASSGSQEDEQGVSCIPQQSAAPRQGTAGDGWVVPQHQEGEPSEDSCAGLDPSIAFPSLQSDLVRGLQSWARMEGFLG